jgi:hypothetical protein
LKNAAGRATKALDMKKTIDTGLNVADSKRALTGAMDAYKARFAEYDPRFNWVSDTRGEFGFTAKGIEIGGNMEIRDNEVDVEMEVPFLFRIFQGRAMDVIREQIDLWVGKVKRGEV